MKPTSEDKIATGIKYLCRDKECKIELRVIGMPEEKVKLQIFDSKDINSIVVRLSDLKKILERK